MRKLLFLFVVTMLSVTAMAQDVIYDKTNDAGVRTVVCSGMDLGVSNGMNVYVALAGFQYKSTIRYSLAVTIGSGHEVEIPDDSKCLLTLGNGKVLELPTVSGGASVLQSIDIEWGDVYKTFRRFGYYNIKAKDLKKTGKNGIDQIEFQLAPSNYVVMFNQDELGGLLTGSLSVINNLFGK